MSPITVKASILSDIETVWIQYTMPEHIIKWNFASEDWHCPTATVDLRPEGKFSARMEAKDGSFGFDFEGIYQEVISPILLSYSLGDGRNVKIDFLGVDAKVTEVNITFDPEQINPTEMQRDGWQAILNNFKKYVECK